MGEAEDIYWMKMALREARKGWGSTSPNPLVGAVIVRDHVLLGKGYHVRAGEGHAEVNAIASSKGMDLTGATIYVTLEPCCTAGRTPACTDGILQSGLSRVVFGCTDPNPKHAGRAAEILRKQGVEVTYPVCEKECRRLNEVFFHWITTGCPYVLLKMAQTLDGKTATASGHSQWVTGKAARQRVQRLRKRADAVMAGAETFRKDDPRFTVRTGSGKVLKTPRRIIVTHHPEHYQKEGFEFVRLDSASDWREYMLRLGKEGVTSILLEGGGTLAASAVEAQVVNRVEFHIAPKLLGGAMSRTSLDGKDPFTLNEAVLLEEPEVRFLGGDLLYSARVVYEKDSSNEKKERS